MSAQYAVAGALAILAAAIHGVAGERLVVRKLRSDALPSSPFGGSAATMLMIRATWHITTIAFGVMGAALVACAPAASGSQACRGVGQVVAFAFAGFLALVVALSARRGPRAIRRHPAPLLFASVAVLAWWGSAVR